MRMSAPPESFNRKASGLRVEGTLRGDLSSRHMALSCIVNSTRGPLGLRLND
jgi:hypothetical protein